MLDGAVAELNVELSVEDFPKPEEGVLFGFFHGLKSGFDGGVDLIGGLVGSEIFHDIPHSEGSFGR